LADSEQVHIASMDHQNFGHRPLLSFKSFFSYQKFFSLAIFSFRVGKRLSAEP